MSRDGKGQEIVGSATTSLRLTGFIGLALAVITAVLSFTSDESQWTASALFLIGAALAFGLLLNALLRS